MNHHEYDKKPPRIREDAVKIDQEMSRSARQQIVAYVKNCPELIGLS